MQTTLEMIKTLREETGMGVMDCRRALEEAANDFQAALSDLRMQSAARAQKQSDREVSEGVIEHYSHDGGRIGVMVEVNTETEFAARSEALRRFAREVALQVTSTAPLYVSDEEIPARTLEELTAEADFAARADGRPEGIIEKITAGVLVKYRNTHVLLRQPYIRDESLNVAQLLDSVAGQIRENIVIRRFVRWEITREPD